jgi:hypothetical protein
MKRTLRRLKSRQGQCPDGRDMSTRVKGLTKYHTSLSQKYELTLPNLSIMQHERHSIYQTYDLLFYWAVIYRV